MGRSTYSQRRRERGGCGGALIAIALIALVGGLIYAFALRPMLSRAVGEQIGGGPVPTLMPQGSQPTSQGGLAPNLEAQADAVLPSAVAALPPGELVVSDADVNDFIAANPEALAPLEQATVSFTGGQAVVDMAAFGLSSSAAVQLGAEDGRIVVTSATIDGPLAMVLSSDDLAASLADKLNAEFASQGRSVEDVRIEEGQMVLVTN
jgi:hypothetical protein